MKKVCIQKVCIHCKIEKEHNLQEHKQGETRSYRDENGKLWVSNYCHTCNLTRRKARDVACKAKGLGKYAHLNSPSWHTRFKDKK